MVVPQHIARRIREAVAELDPPFEGHIDAEAKRHGAIALMGTIGSVWLLRDDGTFWDVDSDSGKPLQPLAADFHLDAVSYGTERYPWLAELLPERSPTAEDCTACHAKGTFRPSTVEEACTVVCGQCHGLGWRER